MTDPTTPEPENRPDPDGPDLDDPLTVDDVVNQPQRNIAAGGGRSGGDSQATRLVALAHGHFRLLRGADGRPYATSHDGPALAYGLRGREGLRSRLAQLYFDTYQQTPSGAALADALVVLEGQAIRSDPEPVALRVAAAAPQRVALDLGAEDGRCVLVDAGGWRIIERSPVLFRRSALTAPLPEPVRGGSLEPLAELLNVDAAGFRLIVGWLVAALLPEIPHPILALVGEQGTAKSTAARLVVSLVDASPAPLRTPPREMRSWAASAAASWVVALDNVSSIPDWLSDTLCKAVTGDGIVERTLHTDDDINILTFRRCIALTSIDAGRLAGDLAERLLTVELARIPRQARRSDAAIAEQYTRARPSILGALLDLTAQVLGALPDVELEDLPRMADFARVLAALDHTQGWTTLADYGEAAAEANRAVLESSPVAQALMDLVGRGGDWRGTAGELLDRITQEPHPRDWPRTARGLSGHLARLAPALEANGIVVERPPTRGAQRTITLRANREVIGATVRTTKRPTRPTQPTRQGHDQHKPARRSRQRLASTRHDRRAQPTRKTHHADQRRCETRVGRVGRVGQITLLTVPFRRPGPQHVAWRLTIRGCCS